MLMFLLDSLRPTSAPAAADGRRLCPDRGTDLSHEQGHRLEELGEATATHEVDLELIEPRCAQAPEVLDDLIHAPLPGRSLFRPRGSDDLAESHADAHADGRHIRAPDMSAGLLQGRSPRPQ